MRVLGAPGVVAFLSLKVLGLGVARSTHWLGGGVARHSFEDCASLAAVLLRDGGAGCFVGEGLATSGSVGVSGSTVTESDCGLSARATGQLPATWAVALAVAIEGAPPRTY